MNRKENNMNQNPRLMGSHFLFLESERDESEK